MSGISTSQAPFDCGLSRAWYIAPMAARSQARSYLISVLQGRPLSLRIFWNLIRPGVAQLS